MTTRTPSSSAAVALAALCLVGAGCGDQGGASRVSYPLQLETADTSKLTTDDGYTVTLSEARLSLGPVRLFAGEPLFAAGPRESWPVRAMRTLLGIGVAHAHPGHYQQGEAMGELLAARVVDLLQPGDVLGSVDGVTGAVRSARVTLSPAQALGGHVIRIRGSAVKGSRTVAFAATLDEPIDVSGIACTADVTAAGGALTLRPEPGRWVERIDFAALDGSQGEVPLKAGTQAHNALARGAASTSAFTFRWRPAP